MRPISAVDMINFRRFEKIPAESSPETADFSDPESMYARWIAPNLHIFEDQKSHHWPRDLAALHKIYLNLKNKPKKVNSNALLMEISMQLSLYEALVLRDIMLTSTTDTQWALNYGETTRSQLTCSRCLRDIEISTTGVQIFENHAIVGQLSIDMEHVLLEKIHGMLYNKPFILDPVWLKSKKKLNAMHITIDTLKTEIVHNGHHPDTLWTDGKTVSRMTISKNVSFNLSRNVVLNIKKIHWKQTVIHTLQWIVPWSPFPIIGWYYTTKLVSKNMVNNECKSS
jgi:hypothetical protein